MSTTFTQPQAARNADRVRVAMAACTTGTEGFTCRGPYVAGTAYAVGDVVTYGGAPYLSLAAANTGNQPDLVPAKWAPLVAAGIDLLGLGAVGISLELPAGAVIGAGAALQAYLLNPATGQLNRAPGLDPADVITAGLNGQGLQGLQIVGAVGRLIVLPNLVGGPCNIYLNGSPRASIMGT